MVTPTTLLLLQGDQTPPPPVVPLPPVWPVRCALTIQGTFPYGPKAPRSPVAVDDNVCFIDEIEEFDDAAEAHALDEYQARGYTHMVVGPIVANGYAGDYPDTDWRSDEAWARFLAYLRRLRARGLRVIFVALPDMPPFYEGDGSMGACVDWPKVSRELAPRWEDPALGPLIDIVMAEWEWNAPMDLVEQIGGYLRAAFPNHPLAWHTPPDHGAPCLGEELIEWNPTGGTVDGEGDAWRRAVAAGFDTAFIQLKSMDIEGTNAAGRTAEEQFAYDTEDFARRFKQGYAGFPLMRYVMFEYASWWLYRDYCDEVTATAWGVVAMQTPSGIDGYGDSGPRAAIHSLRAVTAHRRAFQRAKPRPPARPPSDRATRGTRDPRARP